MNFQEAYKFPLNYPSIAGKVFTDDYNVAFDFANTFLYPNAFMIPDTIKSTIVDALNNPTGEKYNLDLDLRYNNGIIYINDQEFIIIRGWGHLTGVGGLKLNIADSAKIQDEFVEYIINRLTNNK